MKIKVKKIIPAKAEQIVEEEKYQCDVCGKITSVVTCYICDRDTCRNCLRFDPHDQSDYPDKWCSICYNLLKEKYGERLTILEEEYNEKFNDVVRRWKEESLLVKNETNLEEKGFNFSIF